MSFAIFAVFALAAIGFIGYRVYLKKQAKLKAAAEKVTEVADKVVDIVRHRDQKVDKPVEVAPVVTEEPKA